MEHWFSALLRLLVRLVLLAAGVLFFLSLLAAALVLAMVWGARALWARITGRPMAPWVLRVDPRAGWRAAQQRGAQWQGAAARGSAPADVPAHLRPLPGAQDVTDVQAREPRA